MKILHTISEVNYCYETKGSKPIKIMCDDLEEYVCKYYTGKYGPAYSLFNEFIAASFLKIWGLPVPDFAIIEVKKEHVLNTGYPSFYFEKPCFGSKFLNFKEVDKLFLGMAKNRFNNEETPMKISLKYYLCFHPNGG